MELQTRKRLWIAAAVLLWAVMLVFNLLTPMVCDDYRYAFSFATGERITGAGQIFPSLAAHGHVLNGRYAPHFFVQLFAMLPEICFDIVNAAVFVLLVAGVYRLGRPGGTYDLWLLAGSAGALILLPPAFGQNMLWMAGACNYLWPAAAFVWLIHPFVQIVVWKDGRDLKPAATAAMTLGGLLFGNCSENLSAAGLMVMGLCILWRLLERKSTPLWMWLTAAATAIGWMILMLAPVDKPTGFSEGGLLGVLLERFSSGMQLWMKHLGVLTVVWAFLVCFMHGCDGRELIGVSVILAVSAMCCHLAMIASDYYPERALLGPVLLMICACVILLPVVHYTWDHLYKGLCLSLCLLAAISMAGALPQNYNRYQLAKARDAQMVQAAADGETDVTTFGILGRSRYDAYYGLVEMSSMPENFANEAYAKYFGVESVTVERVE